MNLVDPKDRGKIEVGSYESEGIGKLDCHFIIMMPQKVKSDSEWMSTPKGLSLKGFISFSCVYRAHCVNHHVRGFQSETVKSMPSLKHLYDLLPPTYPRMVISAKF